jgi:IS4 transposase
MHTLFDVATQIPAFIHITEAKVSDVKAMDEIPYEPNAYYIFDRGYFDLARLYRIDIINSNFIIRQRGKLKYEIIQGNELLEGADNILFDQVISLTGPLTKQKYPGKLRRIGFYSIEHKRTFIYLSNNFEIDASQIALLYKNRWQVELFFKWIKQHLLIKSFWGTSENAVRIQISSAITAYCLVAIVENELKLGRTTFEVLRILSASLLDKTRIHELFKHDENADDRDNGDSLQLPINF